jgi:hypothetical protein
VAAPTLLTGFVRRSFWLAWLGLLAGCSGPAVLYVGSVGVDPLAVPATWQEHWFEHTQALDLIASDDAVAVYYDHDIDRAATAWVFPYVSRIWKYTLQAYGALGPGRFYVILHQGRYLGCHLATHFDVSHDYRNVIDCGFAQLDQAGLAVYLGHMAALVVAATADGRTGSPADVLWGDSKWAEFYRYDAYVGTGMTADAADVYARWTADAWTDSFPVQGTHWFRDWFYPLWHDHGGAQVMSRFFASLARAFPASGNRYARDMNWGEFVHFMSGAAATDLKAQATAAFGWPAEWEAQWQAARAAFPAITY